MDEIDLIILRKLLENSRLTYRELANITNMSVSAIYNRIKNLIDDEIISAFIARPSPIALKYLIVTIFGKSNAKSMDAVSKELGQHENVFTIAIASGLYTAQGFEVLSAGLTGAVSGMWKIKDADQGKGIIGFTEKAGLWQTRRRMARDFWVD